MYLVAMLLLCLAVIMLDRICRTKLITNWKFWAMQLFTAIMAILFDIFANGFIWSFNTSETIGIFIINTPLENLLFCFVMVGATLVLFERSLAQNR